MPERTASAGFYDAHCHLQDHRLAPFLPEFFAAAEKLNIRRMVVNGTREEDWPAVLELAAAHPSVIPSLGLHPWHVGSRSGDWSQRLEKLAAAHACGIGEIGLDRWIEGYDSPAQEQAFVEQLRLAARLNRPASIHCLRAWGRLLEILSGEPRPACGFLLHSYGGPAEMIHSFCDLGAYFSFSGYFAHPRKQRQRDVFRSVPTDRLLIETDAPDMLPPGELRALSVAADGEELNHPGNLPRVYRFAAEFLARPVEELAATVEASFQRLFGQIKPAFA